MSLITSAHSLVWGGSRVKQGMLVVDADRIKREKLQDIMRRIIANPSNIDEVVDQVAMDWFPMVRVDPKGRIEIVVGSGKKR